MSDTYSVSVCPREKLDPFLPLIFSKWLRSLRYGNDYFRLIKAQAYYTAYHRYIQAVLNAEATQVRLAALTDDPDVVLGFSVSRGPILDYVHVHKDQRLQGIGKALVPKDITTITCLTRTALAIWGTKYPKLEFNPFA
jgi:GNAT superfamily N-acetyltransferase